MSTGATCGGKPCFFGWPLLPLFSHTLSVSRQKENYARRLSPYSNKSIFLFFQPSGGGSEGRRFFYPAQQTLPCLPCLRAHVLA